MEQPPRLRDLFRVWAGIGLQSFGEGLDLPGELCETVFITKLPFAPPSA
mgnify:CR=1 FL=1